MKRVIAAIALLLAGLWCLSVMAEDAAVRTWTPFADMDPSAQGWETLLQAWQQQTGIAAEDYSGVQDESWLAALAAALPAEADVVVLSPGMGPGKDALLTAEELYAAGVTDARSLPCMEEADGTALLVPVRLGYETLFVNTDVLALYGLTPPATWEDLIVDCAILSQAGVTPVANALTEWAEIVLDCCAAIGAPGEAFGGEASRAAARDVLSDLVAVGAFGSDPWNAEDAAMAEAFLTGQAAMRFDAWDLSLSVPEDRQDAAAAVMLPSRDGAPMTSLPGTVSCGLAVTRAAARDPERFEAARSLASRMLSQEGLSLLSGTGGALAESGAALLRSLEGVSGTLYDADPDSFDDWADATVAALMSGTENE